MKEKRADDLMTAMVMTITIILIVAALDTAEDVFIPFTLAVLLSFLLAPVVKQFERLRMPRFVAVLVTVLVSSSFIAWIGYIIAAQVLDLADNFPKYRENIHDKIVSIRSADGGISRVTRTIEQFKKELETTAADAGSTTTQIVIVPSPEATPNLDLPSLLQPTPAPVIPDKPMLVQIVPAGASELDFMRALLGPLGRYMGTAAAVMLLVVFMLLQREELRDRLIRLAGPGRLNVTTRAMDEAAHRVSRYLLMQTIVNVTYGIPIAIGLYFIGIPNAFLWGFLATILRFLPYAGPWIAATFPIILSLAVFNTWDRPIMTVGLYIVVELVSNNLIEPFLYGQSTGVSIVALLIAAAFWTWLWGLIGLFLSTPLTVCLVVLGRYVPNLGFLDILLTDRAVLEPQVRFYQRLLANDLGEATRVVEETAKCDSMECVYDTIMIPALTLAEYDSNRGALDDATRQSVRDNLRELIEDSTDIHEKFPTLPAEEQSPASTRARFSAIRVLTLPARDESDELVGIMLTQILLAKGFSASHLSVRSLASEMLDKVDEGKFEIVVVSALPPFAESHARYLCKRIRARYPNIVLITGIWDADSDIKVVQQRLALSNTPNIVTTLEGAAKTIEQISVSILPSPQTKEKPETSDAKVPGEK